MKLGDYVRHDAVGLAQLVRRGEVSAEDLLDTAIAATEAIDSKIHSVVHRFLDLARQQVRELPREAPLRGVPFLLKDLNIQMASTPLTNGSRLWRDFVCDHDSEAPARYRSAGLVIFGRTASPEMGLTTTTESQLFGKTRNPWNLERTAGGSSGGAAAAVAAGIVPAAHASDGGGSIRIPASCCGLFGLKPTRARVTVAPDKGHGWSGLSTQHVVSRSVRDSAALLDAIEGPSPGDPYWAPPPARPYTEEVRTPAGQLRIAFTTQSFNGSATDPECVRAVESTVELCRSLGHQVAEARPEVNPDALRGVAGTIVGGSLRASFEDRARALGRPFRQDDVEPLSWLTAAVDERKLWEYPRAVDAAHAMGRAVGRFFLDHDALLTPTMAAPPLPLGRLALDRADGEGYLVDLMATIGYTNLMNVAGNPAMSVPLHWSEEDMPIGVQFAAALGREDLLFRLAAQLEESRPWFDRRPAGF
ncbi:MAG TPA: amidase family protein [Thermoanaerobaculia bacterium]|nr:amidase family protein [Thermoanaerobaculia bacterium]